MSEHRRTWGGLPLPKHGDGLSGLRTDIDTLKQQEALPVLRGYAHEQGHILSVEHAHENDLASRAAALARIVVKFAGHVDELSASGISGLAVVLPGPLFDTMAQVGGPDTWTGLGELRLVASGGFVTIRRAEGT